MRSGRVTLSAGPDIWDADMPDGPRIVVSGEDVLLLCDWIRECKDGRREGGTLVLRMPAARYSAAAQRARLVPR